MGIFLALIMTVELVISCSPKSTSHQIVLVYIVCVQKVWLKYKQDLNGHTKKVTMCKMQ